MSATTAHDLIPTHVTQVVRTERISPGFVRVTFGCGLDRFAHLAPDQFVYVLVPPPGCDELTIGIDFRWADYYELPEATRPVGAYYTVRAHRPDIDEIDCDVFLHDPAGHASRWATERAATGAPAALWGPRTTWAPPAATARWLLLADDTGIPAVEAILDTLPAAADVTIVIEHGDKSDVLRLERTVATRPATTLLDRRRPPNAAGTTDTLVDTVRALDLDGTDLYAWGGAESRAMRDVRQHLRRERGLSRERVSMTPYWRHVLHADDPVEDD